MTGRNRPAATGTVAITRRHRTDRNSNTMNARTVDAEFVTGHPAPDSRERRSPLAVRRPQPADRPSSASPTTAAGWPRPPAREPAVPDLPHRRDRPSLTPEALGHEPWVLVPTRTATRVGVKGRRFAAELPTYSGAKVQTGRLIFATTDRGRLRAYREGQPGFVRGAPRVRTEYETDGPIIHLQNVQNVADASAWIRVVRTEAAVVAEVGDNRSPAPGRGRELAGRGRELAGRGANSPTGTWWRCDVTVSRPPPPPSSCGPS